MVTDLYMIYYKLRLHYNTKTSATNYGFIITRRRQDDSYMYDCIQGSVILPGGETCRPAHEMDSPVTTHPPWVPLHAAGAGPPTH